MGSPILDLKVSQQKNQLNLHHALTNFTQMMAKNDPALYKHALRVQYLTYRMTSTLNLNKAETVTIELAALLHDVGKLEIQNAVLYKKSPLTEYESELIRQHCLFGARMLSRFPVLEESILPVLHHHERWDGQGYPLGLKKELIPLGARIIAIVDAFEVMLSQRVYQPRRSITEARNELRICAGSQFDPGLVVLFDRLIANNLYDLL